MAEVWAVLVVLIGSFIGAMGAMMFKKSSKDFSFSIPGIIKNKILVVGSVFYIISFLLFSFALKGGELSVLFPVVSTSYVWTVVFSIKFLNERMNLYKWAGIFLIIIGIYLLNIA